MGELDLENHKNGSSLDEMKAHVFLESFSETLTVREMRESLRASGAIGLNERPKEVPLTHILIFRYQVDWREYVNSSQGDNRKEIEEATKKLEEVSEAFRQSEERKNEATIAHINAEKKEAEAKSEEESAKRRAVEAVESAKQAAEREEEARAAQRELELALAEVQKQEDAYNAKKAELERKSEEGGIVSRNKAKAELAQHLAEDPLPLRRAKITAEAAVKKAERTAHASADAKIKAEHDAHAAKEAAIKASEYRANAEKAARSAAEAKRAAEDALNEARKRLEEAEQFLNEVKSRPGSGGAGAIWWLERELHEQRKYLPESKGGIRK